MKRSIFCDLDGTLIDTSPRHHLVYCENVKKIGGKPLDRDSFWTLKRDNVRWVDMLKRSGLDLSEEDEKFRTFMKGFISQIESEVELKRDELFPGVLPTLCELKKHNVLYLVTLRRSRGALLTQLRDLGILSVFEKVLNGHSEDANTFHVKVKLIQEQDPTKESIVIGDTEADVKAAKALGVRSVAVKTGIRSSKYLSALQPDFLVESFNDLTSLVPPFAFADRQ